MGGGFADSGCKRHPHEHLRQLPGVCPSCLTEKLSKLNTIIISPSSDSATVKYSIADSNSSLSSLTSTSNSPSQRRYRRNHSDIAFICGGGGTNSTRKFPTNLVGNSDVLKKSRSVACAAPVSNRDESGNGILKKKKSSAGSLWKKLIRSASKKSSSSSRKGVRMDSEAY